MGADIWSRMLSQCESGSIGLSMERLIAAFFGGYYAAAGPSDRRISGGPAAAAHMEELIGRSLGVSALACCIWLCGAGTYCDHTYSSKQ